MKAIIHVECDEPVLVLVVPLMPPRKVRELPASTRRVVETTAEPVPSNVVELRRAG